MNDLVSIIMPSYNTGKYIKKSIESIQNQNYKNWELIIIDDCSTDNTDEVVKAINDKRIKYIKNDKNYGAAVSRNKALKEAKGRWIAFLDSDDLWVPEKLQKQIDFMKKNFNYTTDFFLKNNIWGNVSYKRKDFDIKDYVNDVVITFNYGRLEIYVINIEKLKHTIKPLKKYLNTAPNMKLTDNKDGYFLCNYDVQTDIFNIIEAIKNIIEAKI